MFTNERRDEKQPNFLYINPSFIKARNVFVNPNFVIAPQLESQVKVLPKAPRITETRNDTLTTSKLNKATAYVDASKYCWNRKEMLVGDGSGSSGNANDNNSKVKYNEGIIKGESLSTNKMKVVNEERAPELQNKQTETGNIHKTLVKTSASAIWSKNSTSINSKYKWSRKPENAKISCPTKDKYCWSRRISDKSSLTVISSQRSSKFSNRLIRKPSESLLKLNSPGAGKRIINKHSMKPAGKLMKIVNKYKLSKASKYKVDNRPVSQQTAKKPKVVVLSNPPSTDRKIARFRQRTVKAGTKNSISPKLFASKKLVNIGGILYRATKRKLTRTDPGSCKAAHTTTLNMRGVRFQLSNNGRTMRRLSSTKLKIHQKVYFGGMTYQTTSDNILMRTNCHQARQLLTTAKHRSIACLNANKRKINAPCLIFRRIGSCAKLATGMCPYTHSRNNVDICKRFLAGRCTGPCQLSHDVGVNKLPTCKYFLLGSCGRDQCPYLHVKLSDNAGICVDFLQGYCPQGQQCTLRHVNICPEFEKSGKCQRENKCPYPHPTKKCKTTSKRLKQARRSSRSLREGKRKREKLNKNDIGEKNRTNTAIDDKSCRYYVGESENEDKIIVLPKRQQLSTLPSFIAFDS